jgi:hypothetical protein
MPLLNYTTTVEVSKSIGEIHAILIRHGALDILNTYKDGAIIGVGFRMQTSMGEQCFQLPANIAGVQLTLKKQRLAGKLQPRFADPAQAARVAWRIVKDWLEAQLALVEAGMTTMDEVMFPYMLAFGTEKTMYQFVKEKHLSLPKPEGASP